MDPKEVFERQARRPLGPMAPEPRKPGLLESVHETVSERLPVPIKDSLPRQLEFRRRTESRFSFPHHYLMGVEYFPHSRLVLTFSTHTVIVSGRNLARLYKGIQQQTTETIQEMDRATALATAEDDPEIQVIEVHGSDEASAATPTSPAAQPVGR